MSGGVPVPPMIELVEQFADLLYRYAYRLTGNAMDAEDLTQQTYLQGQRKLQQLRDSKSAKWWLISILRNTFLTSRRNAGRFQSLDGIEESLCVDEPPDDFIDPDELQTALLELSEEYRSPLILFYFEEFTYQEIADQMGLPIGTVMSRLSRAKALLRWRLSEDYDFKAPRLREKVIK